MTFLCSITLSASSKTSETIGISFGNLVNKHWQSTKIVPSWLEFPEIYWLQVTHTITGQSLQLPRKSSWYDETVHHYAVKLQRRLHLNPANEKVTPNSHFFQQPSFSLVTSTNSVDQQLNTPKTVPLASPQNSQPKQYYE